MPKYFCETKKSLIICLNINLFRIYSQQCKSLYESSKKLQKQKKNKNNMNGKFILYLIIQNMHQIST